MHTQYSGNTQAIKIHTQHIDQTTYEDLREGGTVIEKDFYGDKVIRLADGNYIKLFRRKRIFSSALLFPYAKRFVSNAEKLKRLNITTVTPLALYWLPHIKRTAVHYVPVAGETLRALTKEAADPTPILINFAKFLADIHHKGIYFRSVHLGNVVVTTNNNFALIDIADLKFFHKPLSERQQKRNMKHLLRPTEDHWLLMPNLKPITSSYYQHQKHICNQS